MVIVMGALNARLLANGNVEICFTTAKGDSLRPMLAKNMDTAEADFIRTYGLKPIEAAAFRSRIEREGSASHPAAL